MKFANIKKNFGFGCMRLPMNNDEVDYNQFNQMIDTFINAGFNYFDTAHGYIGGKSETAIRDCLVARYNREDYILANKLSAWFFESESDIIPLFENQLKLCGVEYFDFYLFHAINRDNYKKHKECNSFEIVKKLKEQGKIRHIALSFHDTADILDMILTEQPSIEAVQLQFNYLDFDSPTVQSKACYDIAVKHGKKVIVMEPVKGGALVNLPDKAENLLKSFIKKSFASFALRFSASFSEVFMVLSGMGNMDMMNDNIDTMSDFIPFSDKEFEIADNIKKIILEVRQIQCTKCNYCSDVCPNNISVSEIFAVYNDYLGDRLSREEAKKSLPYDITQPLNCIKCGECEKVCPQNISIRNNFEKMKKDFYIN